MILEEGLFAHLKKAKIAASIYGQLRGDRLPAVVYTLISDPVTTSLPNVDQIRASRYQIDCYSRKYLQVKQLAKDVTDALHHYKGLLGDYPVQGIFLENRVDGFEPQANFHRQILTFVIYHHADPRRQSLPPVDP